MRMRLDATLVVEEFLIAGYAQPITLRSYNPTPSELSVPIVFYFHGGGFVGGKLDDADFAARRLARRVGAWVISIGYSLSPDFPFPAALEDGYCAVQYAAANARAFGADEKLMGVAGHDAGGNLAACLCAVVRDRRRHKFLAQALIAPLLDPSMTRLADRRKIERLDLDEEQCAKGYRAYLKNASQAMHPYAAPIESKRLESLPPAYIASAQNDLLRVEAERYSCRLISAGVPTEVTRYENLSHHALGLHLPAIDDVSKFFAKRLLGANRFQQGPNKPNRDESEW